MSAQMSVEMPAQMPLEMPGPMPTRICFGLAGGLLVLGMRFSHLQLIIAGANQLF
jgi:hypothetical protein